MTSSSLHPCARCSTVQKTCCQSAEVLVTLEDVERIRARTHRTDFAQWRIPEDAVYSIPSDEDPNWLRWTLNANGQRRMLVRNPNGDCTFLGEHGCTLGADVRPLVCRLYPFSYNEGGILGIDDHFCPRELLLSSGETMVDLLGMVRAESEAQVRQLYGELRLEHENQPAARSRETQAV